MMVAAVIVGVLLLLVIVAVGGIVMVRSGVNPYVQDRHEIAKAVRAIPGLVAADHEAQRSIRELRREIRAELAVSRQDLREEIQDARAALVDYVDKSRRDFLDMMRQLNEGVQRLRTEQAEFRGAMTAKGEQTSKELEALFRAYGAARERDRAVS